VNDPPVQCHFLAAISAMMTDVAARNAFASLPVDAGVFGVLSHLAASATRVHRPVILAELERQLVLLGVFPDGYFSRNQDSVLRTRSRDHRRNTGGGVGAGGTAFEALFDRDILTDDRAPARPHAPRVVPDALLMVGCAAFGEISSRVQGRCNSE
jgi:hypothetical protein